MILTNQSKQDKDQQGEDSSPRSSNRSKHGPGGQEDGQGGEREGEQVAEMSSWRTEQAAKPCCAEALETGGQATRSVVVRRTRTGIRGHGGLLKFGVVMVVEAELARGGVAGRYIVGGACPRNLGLGYLPCFDVLCILSTHSQGPRPFPKSG